MATAPRIKKLARDLNDHPLVDSATYTHKAIIVKFKNGIKEWWWRQRPDQKHWHAYRMPKDPGTASDEIQIGREYNYGPLDDEYEIFKRFFLIRRSVYQKASFAAQRLLSHRLIEMTQQEGWVDLKYPRELMIEDFLKLREDRLDRFNWRRSLRIYGVHGSGMGYGGRLLLEHFHEIGAFKSLAGAWLDSRTMYYAIRGMMSRKRDITRAALIREINTLGGPRRAGEPFLPCNFFRAVFRRFGISGDLADPEPSYGSKAIAAAVEGISYHHGNGPFSEISESIGDFLGTQFFRMSEERYGTVFLDFDWDQAQYDPDQVGKWRKRSERVLCYVPHARRQEAQSFNPVDVQEVEVGLLRNQKPDYLFLV